MAFGSTPFFLPGMVPFRFCPREPTDVDVDAGTCVDDAGLSCFCVCVRAPVSYGSIGPPVHVKKKKKKAPFYLSTDINDFN